MSTDESLIRRLRPVLEACAPAPGEPVHAEVLHQLCMVDGLLELLDWSSQGLSADPLACMWLGSLRWHRMMTGRVPRGAPEPPSHEAERLLGLAFAQEAPGRSAVAQGSGSSSLSGLASGQMGYPASPNQPEDDDGTALLRVVPIGLVPYVEEAMRLDWAEQAVCLTHGAESLRRRARGLAALFARAASGARTGQQLRHEAPAHTLDLRTELEEILRDTDQLTTAVLRRQFAAALRPADVADGETAGQDLRRPLIQTSNFSTRSPKVSGTGVSSHAEAARSALCHAIDQLTEQWERVTSPAR